MANGNAVDAILANAQVKDTSKVIRAGAAGSDDRSKIRQDGIAAKWLKASVDGTPLRVVKSLYYEAGTNTIGGFYARNLVLVENKDGEQFFAGETEVKQYNVKPGEYVPNRKGNRK